MDVLALARPVAPIARTCRPPGGRRHELVALLAGVHGRLELHEIRRDLDRAVVLLGEAVEPDRLADLRLDLVADVDVLGEELPRVLLALAELLTLVGEPGAALLDHLEVDADVQ